MKNSGPFSKASFMGLIKANNIKRETPFSQLGMEDAEQG
jgi:hypothetical protein